MSHYKSNLRDIFFNLFEVLDRDQVLGHGPYEDMDHDTAVAVLTEIEHLARTKLAASYVDGDRTPPVYDPVTKSVTLPESFKKSYAAFMDAGFYNLELPAALGGQPSPPSLQWAANELNLGANPALFMYSAGPKFATVLWYNGTERDQRIAQIMVDRQWGATMVLTEPDAGSDVGAGRTRAVPQPDGSWHIEGVKRFITSGEQDMTENIIHLVLARPVGVDGAGGPGTKGLSLFVVPKLHFDLATGELTGERNGVYATNVEHKMGIKVSTTCELTFGDGTPAKGWLLGEVHDGIAQMFQVIEHARMLVGTKAIATLSSGYLNALEYAKSRVQGPDLTRASDRSAPRVTITHHPDIRRSLVTQKAYAEGLRALVLFTASVQDRTWSARLSGGQDEAADRLNDLLLPIVKGYGSERSWVTLGTESLQTFGGSGFLADYPLEQYVRDAKIDTLYEGTTAIQGQDLFFRKIVKDNGRALADLSTQIGTFIGSEAGSAGLRAPGGDIGLRASGGDIGLRASGGDIGLRASGGDIGLRASGGDIGLRASGGDGQLKEERALLERGLEGVGSIVATMTAMLRSAHPTAPEGDVRNVYKVGLNTTRLLMAMGDVICAWLLLRGAEVALQKLTGGLSPADKAFYEGKVASARWFARTVLPRLAAEAEIAEATDLAIMDLPEAAF